MKVEDGSLIVNDREINRAERFDSDPAKVLTRQLGRYFGLVYSHPSGVQAFLKFADDFAQLSGWTIGFAKRCPTWRMWRRLVQPPDSRR